MQILKKGNSGPAVLELQTLLFNQGFFGKTLPTSAGWTFGEKLFDAVVYFQQTHLGPDGMPLTVDGWVGSDTWWALKHPSGKAQRSNLLPKIPKGITGERAEVLKVAMAEHAKNIREIPNGSNRSKEIDKYFPQWLQDKIKPGEKGPAWCCFSANWVFYEATGRWPCGSRTGSCSQMVKMARKLGILYEPRANGSAILPIIRPGDLFVILHPQKPGKPVTGHIGIVGSVNPGMGYIGTYEGNCGNRYKAGLRNIAGYVFINPYGPECQPTNFERRLPKVSSVAGASTR